MARKPTYEELETKVKEFEEEAAKRKRAEQARESLREGEEHYRTLAEHVAEGVTLIQEGKLLFVNHAFCSMFGYGSPKQIVGKRIDDLIPDAFGQGIKDIYRSFESDISSEKTFRAVCHKQDGQQFWVEGHHVATKSKGKPALITTIRDITERRLQDIASQDEVERLQGESTTLRSSIKYGYKFGNIVGKSQAIQQVYDLISMAADSDANVVISGESGTGKELVAQSIHEMSNRRDRAFVSVNCGAMPETLLESEFFGYKKGAFTGAYTDKHGYLDLADGGTLFLDELGEIGLGMQVKLLRAFDGRGYAAVGSTENKKSDFRIIAASNGDLMDLMKKRLIREDFFYRIYVIPIAVPPLRDRKEDIPLLIDHFLKSYGNDKQRSGIPGRIMQSLLDYDWPGNVRELQNVLHRYFAVKRLDLMGPIGAGPDYLNGNSGENLDPEDLDFHRVMEKFQKNVIVRALEQTQWHKGRAATMLGIDRKTLFRKMKSLGLN
ncbi:MAG: sigma 54-interacting transcriptional regulator [Deltaproteobacteria bacterium]|nr:sigma 54-interacting transcriptional regulator [Deltaproteobacteria bacterium]MBW2078379.1 sigma 54-interacting transcriptional regulator [Deltaproteobacteria bacterium]